MKKNPQIFWAVIFLILAGLAWWGIVSFGPQNKNIGEIFGSSEDNEEVIPLGEGQSVEDVSSTDKKYKNSVLGFSFSYESEYSISSFGNYYDSTGETVLLQKNNGESGVQVLITPFDEDVSLTINRIKKDLPSISVLEAKEMQIGSSENKTVLVTFRSDNASSIGESREAWFVWNRNLYQISSKENSVGLFDKIIKSWELEQ